MIATDPTHHDGDRTTGTPRNRKSCRPGSRSAQSGPLVMRCRVCGNVWEGRVRDIPGAPAPELSVVPHKVMVMTETPAAIAEEVVPKPRRPALSPSRAGDFKQCPLLYRFRAVDRLPETPSEAQVRGIVVHAVLEELFALPAAERVPDRAHALLGPVWARLREERQELADLFPTEDSQDHWLE